VRSLHGVVLWLARTVSGGAGVRAGARHLQGEAAHGRRRVPAERVGPEKDRQPDRRDAVGLLPSFGRCVDVYRNAHGPDFLRRHLAELGDCRECIDAPGTETAARPAVVQYLVRACIAQTYMQMLQVEGADAKEKDEARGAGGGRQESWVVGILAALVVAAVCGLALVPVVGRAKQCWDFAATAYILHLVACSCYTRFPVVNYTPMSLCANRLLGGIY
jgi:hypothetical protein